MIVLDVSKMQPESDGGQAGLREQLGEELRLIKLARKYGAMPMLVFNHKGNGLAPSLERRLVDAFGQVAEGHIDYMQGELATELGRAQVRAAFPLPSKHRSMRAAVFF